MRIYDSYQFLELTFEVRSDQSGNNLLATLQCEDPNLFGRYIVIEKTAVGRLGFRAIKYEPVPGKLIYCQASSPIEPGRYLTLAHLAISVKTRQINSDKG